MNKPMLTLLAAAALLAGCAKVLPVGPQAPSANAMSALKQDRKPVGPAQSAMDDMTFLKMVDLDKSNSLSFEEFMLFGIFPAVGYGIKVQPTAPTLEDIQRKVFHDFDKNNDNVLSSREFKELGSIMGSFVSYKSLEEIAILIDVDENSALTLREWKMLGIFGVHRKQGDKSPRALTEWLVDTFERLDANDDGVLKEKEQRMVWQTMWYDGKPWLQ